MNQSQQARPQAGYGASQDELHMSGMGHHHGQMPPHDYAPQIKLDQAPPLASQQQQHHQGSASVPNALQPGVVVPGRSQPMSATSSGGSIPTMHGAMPLQQQQQQPMQDYPPPGKQPMSMTHSYSRSSPAAGYDAPVQSSYHAYTPTTPGGSSSQFGMPPDMMKYGAPGSQRHISNTPLGLADIRPRADSSMSDSPGAMGMDAVPVQPGPSNYLAPWAIYAFDWCKWRPQGNGAGKVAVGSYLEDGHNFV